MLYQIDSKADTVKFYSDPHSRIKIPYRTVKEMRKIYPNDNFTVIGEIGCIARLPNNGDHLFTGNGAAIAISPRGSLKKPFEWVTGYVAVGKDTYLAVIGGLIPGFIKRAKA